MTDIGVPKAAPITQEGWLTKKGQKRYFILSNITLSWKSHPLSVSGVRICIENVLTLHYQGEMKKSINVQKCMFDFGEAQDIPTIIIKPSVIAEPTFTKQYELEAKDWREANIWLDNLRLAARQGDDKSAFVKEGWLEKKGKRRWFLLHKNNGVLYWFGREQDRKTDFTRNIKGQLSTSVITDATPVSTGTLNKQKPAFKLSTSTPGVEYILTAKTWSEMVEWISAIHTCCGTTAKTTSPNRCSAAGYLTKKGKKRYFVLECNSSSDRYHLSWYANEKASIYSLPM